MYTLAILLVTSVYSLPGLKDDSGSPIVADLQADSKGILYHAEKGADDKAIAKVSDADADADKSNEAKSVTGDLYPPCNVVFQYYSPCYQNAQYCTATGFGPDTCDSYFESQTDNSYNTYSVVFDYQSGYEQWTCVYTCSPYQNDDKAIAEASDADADADKTNDAKAVTGDLYPPCDVVFQYYSPCYQNAQYCVATGFQPDTCDSFFDSQTDNSYNTYSVVFNYQSGYQQWTCVYSCSPYQNDDKAIAEASDADADADKTNEAKAVTGDLYPPCDVVFQYYSPCYQNAQYCVATGFGPDTCDSYFDSQTDNSYNTYSVVFDYQSGYQQWTCVYSCSPYQNDGDAKLAINGGVLAQPAETGESMYFAAMTWLCVGLLLGCFGMKIVAQCRRLVGCDGEEYSYQKLGATSQPASYQTV